MVPSQIHWIIHFAVIFCSYLKLAALCMAASVAMAARVAPLEAPRSWSLKQLVVLFLVGSQASCRPC